MNQDSEKSAFLPKKLYLHNIYEALMQDYLTTWGENGFTGSSIHS